MTDSENEDSPAFRQLVAQRIRNRQMEWLEMAVEIESDPPPFDLAEVVNQWFDVNLEPAVLANYSAPVYTAEEAECMVAAGSAMERFCDATPHHLVDAEALVLPEWAELVAASTRALEEMSKRGRLAEEFDVKPTGDHP